MKCIRCGTIIPPGSQFCLRCGAPVAPAPGAPAPAGTAPVQTQLPGTIPPPAGSSTVYPPQVYPAGAGLARKPNPARAAILTLGVLLLCLIAATAAVIHQRQGMTSAIAVPPGGGSVANAPVTPPGQGGLANANAPALQGGGVANAPYTPPAGGGIANMQTRPPQGGGVATQPSIGGPQTAKPPDDVMPYLRALAQIEAQRQQISNELEQQFSATASDATGSQHVTDPQAAMSAVLAKEIGSIGNDDNGPDPLTTYLQKLTPVVADIANKHVTLLREVDYLAQVPGVPRSCRDLQGYYRASITPFVSLANAERTNPTQFLTQAMTAQQQESTRLIEAEQALGQVFRSHNIQPFFVIKDTEDTGAGGVMSAPYVPGP